MKPPFKDAFRRFLIGFSVSVLLLMLQHIVFYATYLTPVFDFLFPNFFNLFDDPRRSFPLPWWLNQYYALKGALFKPLFDFFPEFLYGKLGWAWGYLYFNKVFLGPLLEEIQFRGPFWILRRHAHTVWWWFIGLAWGMIWVVIHPLGIGELISIFGITIITLWLIKTTGRFWPALLLHMTFNAHFIFWQLAF